ncbi:MAG: tRNA (guanine(10)-N(2))-dimethyltransferase [Candidatus Heimdallarchaeota archaeon]|nr:tRNA (guanine(10)-N(2))-dimethyltransferase [Candidatus Heimdallarchaeota archaeon]
MIDYPLTTIVEGITKILVPDLDAYKALSPSFPPSEAPVFYNPRMEINRDFALAMLRTFVQLEKQEKQLSYCEPMAGTAVRTVRVANEIENINVIINDINPSAIKLIKKNIQQLNLKKKTRVFFRDANELLIHHAVTGEQFDVIDLDPFGSPARFMDATAQAIAKGGLLAITSTDMATKCGVYPQACIRKYCAQPIHSWIGHEVALRILLGFVIATLARHQKRGKPVFAHSTAHFIRVYLTVAKGNTKAKQAMKNLGYIAHCPQCGSLESTREIVNSLTRVCPYCEQKRLLGGPLWLGQLYDKQYVDKLGKELNEGIGVYGTKKRMTKILSLISDEVKAFSKDEKTICYYDLHKLSDKLNLPVPKTLDVIETLQKQDYVASRTHFKLTAIKTNAPIDKINTVIGRLISD